MGSRKLAVSNTTQLNNVFIIPTIVIVVSYGMIAKQLFRDSTGDSEAFQVTFVMISLTAAFLFCWWPVCIYLSVRWKEGIGSRGFYFGLLNSLVNLSSISSSTPPSRPKSSTFSGA